MRKIFFLYLTTGFIFFILLFTRCQENFLERTPLDELTDASYWNNSNDLKNFVNGFYQLFPRYRGDNVEGEGNDGADNTRRDHPSDILVVAQNSPSGTLMQAQTSGQAPNTDAEWTSNYQWIRQINYFIENSKKVARDESTNQYIGEGYFFRAWVYFELLKKFGGVPYITRALNTSDKEELYKTRDSRTDVAQWIVNDLDSAIINLNWKGSGSAGETGRINKEAAMVMKARVALYEGTWERYHSSKTFGVPNKDGVDFLKLIEPTIDLLIEHQGTNIFIDGGQIDQPYNQLFSQIDASSTPGVFLYRVYNASLIGGHSFYEKMTRGPSFTDHLVYSYLDKNGKPQELSELPIDSKSLYTLSKYLDPRFNQTIWTPDKGSMKKVAPSLGDNPIYVFNSRYPYISNTQSTYPQNGQGGYKWWKGAILDPEEFRNGSTDDILIRYAEGLLAYAEAKAILGTLSQDDLDKTINLLRSRVNMAPMVLSEIHSYPNSIYKQNFGFDPSESNIVNEIRRERLIELAGEGFRLGDLKRWAIYESVINGYKPKGAHIDQFLNYYNDSDSLITDGYSDSEIDLLKLTIGNGFNIDEGGYINPFYNVPEFRTNGVGYYIDPKRDYLSPIPKGEIELYQEKAGVELEQNPGWF